MHSAYLQLGHLHIPIYGVFAAIGLMASLALSQRTARYVGLSPEVVWNAGVTAIFAAFVISRLLLIAFDWRNLLAYPMLILTLPSLTTLGTVLTAVFMLAYVRWRKLPLLSLLDAAAPCAALFWEFLSLGRIFDGTHDGMPLPLPRRIVEAIPTSAPTHPVEFYTLIAASLICLVSLRILRFDPAAGQSAAVTLFCSGMSIFVIDCFRLPSELFDRSPLEGAQIIGIAMILVGAALFLRARNEIKRESGTEPPHAI